MSEEGAGTVGRPAPDRASGVDDFVRQLRLLKAWAGNPSLDRLSRRTGLPRSTLFDALNPERAGLPALDLVRQYVRACDCTDAEVEEWIAAWRRIQAGAVSEASGRRATGTRSDVDTPRPSVPRNLPAATRHFVGRSDHLKALDELAFSDGPFADGPAADGPAGGPRIAAITGMAGVGKTTLAVHWAHQVAHRLPDGQLYIDLRGFDPAATPLAAGAVLRAFLEALGVRAEHVPADLNARIALYRSVLADRRLLLVLDNAMDAGHVRPLLPGGSGCVVLVTSRDRLTGLIAAQGALPVQLDLFDAGDARDLVDRHLGPDRGTAEPEAVTDLLRACGGLPLALTVAAVRAAGEPNRPLSALTAELSDSRRRLSALESGDAATSLRAVLSCSYRRLGAAAQRLFRLLGVHPGPIGAPAAASLTGVPPEAAPALLDELVQAHLLCEPRPGRYGQHNLLRAYAAELAADDPAESHEATGRLLDHYLRTALPAAELLNPIPEPLALPPARSDVSPEHLDNDSDRALAWFRAEHRALVAIVQLATGGGFEPYAWPLARSLVTFLDGGGLWEDSIAVLEAALDAAIRLDDLPTQAETHVGLGTARSRLGEDDRAVAELRKAIALFAAAAGPGEQASAHFTLSSVLDRLGDRRGALEHAQQAYELATMAGDRRRQASALNNVGWHRIHLGEPRQALVDCGRALALFEELDVKRGVSVALDSLGHAHALLGEHRKAIRAYKKSLEIEEALGGRLRVAETRTSLGDAYEATGRIDAALENWRLAVDALEDLGHASAAKVRERLRRYDASDRSSGRGEAQPSG